jgi:hypothetical protein
MQPEEYVLLGLLIILFIAFLVICYYIRKAWLLCRYKNFDFESFLIYRNNITGLDTDNLPKHLLEVYLWQTQK